MQFLAQALMAQAHREVVSPVNPIGVMGAYKIKEFLRINYSEFTRSKVEEDRNGFMDNFYKTLAIIG